MRKLLFASLLSVFALYSYGQRFEDYFEDRTLRLDYIFAGDSSQQQIYVDELISLPRWYGKRQRLAEVPLRGPLTG